MQLSDITLIIPTKNEEKNIDVFLSALPSDLKLIIVDASIDQTRERIRTKRPINTQIIGKESAIPAARQAGAEMASSPWILYSDADMIFDPGYFTYLKSFSLNDNVGAVMGAKLSQNRYRWYYFLYSKAIAFFAFFGIPIGSGSNMLIRKDALNHVGGFDFSLTHSEDNDILMRIKKAGWKVIYKGQLKVYENDHRRLDQGVFKKFWHGTVRAFFLYTGLFKSKVQQSDWGYWDKKTNE